MQNRNKTSKIHLIHLLIFYQEIMIKILFLHMNLYLKMKVIT